MFWGKKSDAAPREIASLPRYVVEKVAPRITSGRDDALIALALRTFERASPITVVERTLLNYGLDDAMMGALALANAVQDSSDGGLTDIEYADCYLCSVFCIALELRKTPQAASDALAEWAARFTKDTDYLVFADMEQLVDLLESGWDRFISYHDHPDAILPRAYLHLLSQVIRQRRRGSYTPYSDLDPMISSDPLVLVALEVAWEGKVRVFSRHWYSLVERIRDAADEHEEEFWQE
ncbi:hypothetical protein [Rhizobium leguminosarum]|uniref:hypothetical protein n=1 Tax=Rhizobium leguminosarum TaxID=384 RepID=UPI00143F14D4|nr:hypothetical protein [Rhizobium leguminosarum]NKL22546.1 hypothetical protein [Rhizobium leguminosarum bv. viciae]